MSFAAKAVKKLGLGSAVTGLLAPFSGDRAALPDPEQARSYLERLRPDPRSSCLTARPEGFGRGTEAELEIVLPVYNVERYLDASLDSILSQETSFPFRVIAVDDGSTDSSGALLDACSDPRLTVIHQKNRGLAGARNAGLDVSTAPWLFFLDSDDLLAPGALEALMASAHTHGASLVEGAFALMDPEGRVQGLRPHKDGIVDPRADCYGYAWGKLISAELFRDLCFPEGYLFEDSLQAQILYPRLERQGLVACGLARETVRYRQNPQGIVRSSHGNPKSLDSLWITLALREDRRRLGFEDDQTYYEYLLNMLLLTFRRTEALGDEVGRAAFALQRDLLLRDFSAFSTARPDFRMLERAVREGDWGRCRLFCSLH